MKLKLSVLKINDIKLAQKTDIREGVVSLNGEGLKEWLKEEERLRNVEVELGRPGEKYRIRPAGISLKFPVYRILEPEIKKTDRPGHIQTPFGADGHRAIAIEKIAERLKRMRRKHNLQAVIDEQTA
jgi:hypothetical protein